jgi:hypothetical protein
LSILEWYSWDMVFRNDYDASFDCREETSAQVHSTNARTSSKTSAELTAALPLDSFHVIGNRFPFNGLSYKKKLHREQLSNKT